MTTNEAKAIFDQAIENAETPEQADDRRLLKAYFTDPDFRAAMEQKVWECRQS